MDYNAFVNSPKSLIIAPAGYGKTFTIAKSLEFVTGKQLILTHTHAGVASIKEKIYSMKIPKSIYNVETISSFSQKYVNAFYTGTDLPAQESKEYHPFITEKATSILKLSSVKDIISASYSGLFVDEYQDCTKQQHGLIMTLSEILPTHILGDPLQGIFSFEGTELVDISIDLTGFTISELDTPYRWINAGKNALGNKLKDIRHDLSNNTPINLNSYNDDDFQVIETELKELLDLQDECRQKLINIVSNPNNNPDLNSLLIIVPVYKIIKNNGAVLRGLIKDRQIIKNQIDFNHSLILIEAIDDKDFYGIAGSIDKLITDIARARKKHNRIKEDILYRLFHKTDVNVWFNDQGIKKKKSICDNAKANQLYVILESFVKEPCANNVKQLLLSLKKNFGMKYNRPEPFYSVLKSLDCAVQGNITVYEAMKKHRNIIRRTGRKIKGKCIGSTLLTKGLEFDTVVILGAHLFDSPKHLYVALTRCCKKLIIFTEKTTLSFLH